MRFPAVHEIGCESVMLVTATDKKGVLAVVGRDWRDLLARAEMMIVVKLSFSAGVGALTDGLIRRWYKHNYVTRFCM